MRSRLDTGLLFSSGDLHAYLGQREQEALAAIERIPGPELLNTPADDLAERFATSYQCEPLVLFPEKTTTDDQEASLSPDEIPDGRFPFADEDTRIPGTMFSFHVPFTGEPDLFHQQGSTISYSPPRAHVSGGELVFAYRSHRPDGPQLRQRFDKDLGHTQQLVANSTSMVSTFNRGLRGKVKSAIDARRARLLKAQDTVAALGFPMRRRDAAPQTYVVPTKRKSVAPSRPPASGAVAFKPEPVLDLEQYEDILRVIENMALVLERSPNAFRTLGEEDLRVHFLVQLNAQFEGAATGETFNANGKTDILIRVENKNIFIAECKFWDGPKVFTETIDQLLGYTSWRDTKTAIMVFNRDAQTSTVVGKIPGLLEAHPNFKRHLPVPGETKFRAVLHQNGDLNRDVIVTVLVFDVPKSDSRRA